MIIEGVIERFSRTVITGWAALAKDGQFAPAKVHLRLKNYGVIEPIRYNQREGGRTGFEFLLPEEVTRLSWSCFLEEFDAVIARSDESTGNVSNHYRVPFFKSVFEDFDQDNRTALHAAQLKSYSLEPVPTGRVAVLTIAHNEHLILPLWARYYSSIFGAENLFVIDQGSSAPAFQSITPPGVNIVSIPRDAFDNWLIERLVANFQRFLLESYDAVLYIDSDEFVCLDPAIGGSATLKEFLLQIQEPVGITIGYDLVHELQSEPSYDPAKPVLTQRNYVHRMPTMDKPVISRIPLNWVPGFHSAEEGGKRIAGLFLLHLRWFDLNFGLHKGGVYRDSSWNQFDLDKRLAEYQRDSAETIEARFRSMAAQARAVETQKFNPEAEYTFIPDWMRVVINV